MNEKELELLLKETAESDSITAFAQEQMAKCPSCSRNNGPNRLKCIYCGAQLQIPDVDRASVRVKPGHLESWQKGWNVIVLPNQPIDASTVSRVSLELSLDSEFLTSFMSAPIPMPLVAAESESEATVWLKRLASFGVEVKIVSDDDLQIQTRPRRLREIRFLESKLELIDFNTQQRISVPAEGLRTIVAGFLFTDRSEKVEKRKRGKSETIEESESFSDEAVADIYFEGDEIGNRILAGGFDFSCLGDKKSRISAENVAELVEQLSGAAPTARLITNYREVRSLLSEVWSLDQSQDFAGPQRSGLMSAESRRRVSRTNTSQFARFSRMQNLLG